MTKLEKALEKALENTEAAKRAIIKELCPVDFGLKNNCKKSKNCEECWNQEVEE